MPAARISLFVLTILSGLFAAGCGKGSEGETLSEYCVRGVVTYQRLPIMTDDDGYPTGLGSPDDAETLPLRGVTVRAVWPRDETAPDGSPVRTWLTGDSTTTNGSGYYYLDLKEMKIEETTPVYVEVTSVFHQYISSFLRYDIRVIADRHRNGVRSPVPQADKEIYSLRKGLDGSAPPDDRTPAVAQAGRTVLNFDIGLDDKWWVGHSAVRHADGAVLEEEGTGSRVAAIIDTAYRAALSFGNPTPGGTLDLHYQRGVTEPLGTYVEYDPERFRQSPGSIELNHIGSVRGGPQHDDAWDQGTILAMMARNNMRLASAVNRFRLPARRFPGADARNLPLFSHLQPTMAMAEGLPDAMAATALGTPYLTSASGTAVRDIRNVTGLPLDLHSGPAMAAFAWELALKLNDIAAPGGPETWKAMDPTKIAALCALTYELATDEGKTFPTYSDVPSLFTQMSLASATYGDALTEEAVAELAGPFFGPVWPRPEEGPLSRFLADWGEDPDSGKEPLPGFSLSMADATLDAEGRFPNLTAREGHVAKATLSKDTAYWLSVSPAPSLPSGASIEVRVVECRVASDENRTTVENLLATLAFGQSHPDRQRVVLRGNSSGTMYYLLFFGLNSPTARAADVRVDVRLEPAH